MAAAWSRRALLTAVALCATAAPGLGALPGTGVVAASAATAAAHHRIGTAPALPRGARVTGRLAGSHDLSIDIALTPRDGAALDSYAAAVSTPGSPEYHRYLTVAQFRRRFAPTDAQVSELRDSLHSAGLSPGGVSANGLLLHVDADAATLASALDTSFDTVELSSGATAYANTAAPQLSAQAAPLVQAVVGLDDLHHPRAENLERRTPGPARTAQAGRSDVAAHGRRPEATANGTSVTADGTSVTANGTSACSAGAAAGYTPGQIGSAYGMSNLWAAGDQGAGQTVALLEFETYTSSDVTKFAGCMGIGLGSGQVKPIPLQVHGQGPAQGADDSEAALDIEQILGLAPQANIDVYEADNSSTGDLNALNAMVTNPAVKTISISWGECEPDIGAAGAAAEQTYFKEAATQGTSVYAAAGDSGSSDCYYPGDGIANDQSTNLRAVDDPGSQQWVTSVGGTSLPSLTNLGSQTVWNQGGGWAGGGGIAQLWAMPPYQQQAAAALGVSAAGAAFPHDCGASACREVPDVSADADPNTGYAFYTSDYQNPSHTGWGSWGGTSAAAPLWAALTALANDSSYCTSAGASVGFSNPALYAAAAGGYASYFTDVTAGNNDSTGANGGLYSAGPDFDLASGLGTPKAAALVPALCGATSGSGGGSGSTSGATTTTTATTPTPTTTTATTPAPTTGPPPGTPTTGSPPSSVLTPITDPVSSVLDGLDPTPTSGTVSTSESTVQSATSAPSTSTGCKAAVTQLRHGTVTLTVDSRHHGRSYQLTFSIPKGCSRYTLAFSRHVSTAEARHARALDKLALSVSHRTLWTLSNASARAGYQNVALNLRSYAGKRITLRFAAAEHGRHSTSFSLRSLELKRS